MKGIFSFHFPLVSWTSWYNFMNTFSIPLVHFIPWPDTSYDQILTLQTDSIKASLFSWNCDLSHYIHKNAVIKCPHNNFLHTFLNFWIILCTCVMPTNNYIGTMLKSSREKIPWKLSLNQPPRPVTGVNLVGAFFKHFREKIAKKKFLGLTLIISLSNKLILNFPFF